MARHQRLFYLRKSAEPNRFIQALVTDILVDPVSDGAGKMSGDRQKANLEYVFAIVAASQTQIVKSYVQP